MGPQKLAYLIIFLLASRAWSFTYVRPVPSAPDLESPISSIKDTISYSVVRQLHRTLFKIESDSRPVNDLVTEFRVIRKGLEYRFDLKENETFHDGTSLNAKIVAESLKKALSDRGGHLLEKYGLGKIIAEKERPEPSTKWIKIYPVGVNKLVIRLSSPSPRLIYYLADPRLSIALNGNLKNGLGPFKIISIGTPNTLTLESTEKKNGRKVSKLVYRKMSLRDALSKFEAGTVHDLTHFELSKNQIDKISGKAKFKNTLFPRTYAFFLNANRISRDERAQVTERLLSLKLKSSCALPGLENQSLVPVGFPGRIDLEIPKASPAKIEKKIVVNIPKGVGEEECIKRKIEESSDQKLQFKVSIVDFSEVVKNWSQKSIDIYYGYIEGESDFSFFEHFLPNSSFPLGSEDDQRSIQIHKKLVEASTIKQRHQISKEFSRHLNGRHYYVPIYSPVGKLVFSKGINIDIDSIQAAYQIDLSKVYRETK